MLETFFVQVGSSWRSWAACWRIWAISGPILKETVKSKKPLKNINKYNLIAIATEWDEFIDYDWNDVFNKIKKPAFIFDGRNLLNRDEIKMIGFNYYSLGR